MLYLDITNISFDYLYLCRQLRCRNYHVLILVSNIVLTRFVIRLIKIG